MKEAGYVLFGIYVLMTAWLLVSGLVQLYLWYRARKRRPAGALQLPEQLPFVSVQVPVYNEKYVVEGLLDSLAALSYPKHLYEVLVLDDSTDETTRLVQRKADTLEAEGVNIHIVRRVDRKGYKAGALQDSLPLCKGELIAIFDADFRPAPNFIHLLLPHLADPAVGLVQARWGHLNREQNFLTRIQSYLLDTYFTIEQAGRQQAGYFTNFCGTAGIWRKQCIEDAGGWDGDVLSEDLDLSYRAQLKGWKIVYDPSIEVPAELPSAMEAFKIQQARWTKGIMQVLRKNAKPVASAPIPLAKKFHAFFHLLGSFVFPCLFLNSMLSLPLLLLRHAYPEFEVLTNVAAIGGWNLVLLTLIFYQGARQTGGQAKFAFYYPIFLVVYMALSVQNTIAVTQGLLGYRSAFVRTPKYANNKASATTYANLKKSSVHYIEWAVLLYFLAGIVLSIYLGDPFYLLLFVMMTFGLAIVISHTINWQKLRQAFTWPKLQWRRLLFLSRYQ